MSPVKRRETGLINYTASKLVALWEGLETVLRNIFSLDVGAALSVKTQCLDFYQSPTHPELKGKLP